jgi:threonine/homoserine/homoserine lactone efflux protein
VVDDPRRLRAAWRSQRPNPAVASSSPRLSAARAWRQGLINDLANPKIAAFFFGCVLVAFGVRLAAQQH